jgi:hypothetical protein
MNQDSKKLICDVVDYLVPNLTPYESTFYLFLLRISAFQNGSWQVQIGKRTLASKIGKNPQTEGEISFEKIGKVIKCLERKGCIVIGETTQKGTRYTVIEPLEVPFVKEMMASFAKTDNEDDYFADPQKRVVIFERDNWICQYCGEKLAVDNVTIDHFVPQAKGGDHSKANLRTCCLMCNSVKSGKTFEEAAPLILRSIQERRQRSQSK